MELIREVDTNKPNKQYNYLIPLIMIYLTFDLSSLVYSYKEVSFGLVIGMASSLIFPLTFTINDIITELYGYRTAKKIIFYGLVCDFLFAFTTYLIAVIPSPTHAQYIAYQVVLGSLLRAITAQTFGVFIGATTNIYLLSKWKVLLKGRHFLIRSIASSLIGEALALIISVLIALVGILSLRELIAVILYAYLYKILFAFLISPLAALITTHLKKKEANSFNFVNPFKSISI